MRAAVLGLTLVTACTYSPGSFQYPGKTFPGTRMSVGCLDLSVMRRGDYDDNAVIAYEFGNRCDHPTPVDLAYAKVTGRTSAGAEVALIPFDPKGELRLMKLDARSFGAEALAYAFEGQKLGETIASVCVDLASIAQDQAGPKVVCLAAPAPNAPPPDTAKEPDAKDKQETEDAVKTILGDQATTTAKALPQATDDEEP